jgi:phasin family protein
MAKNDFPFMNMNMDFSKMLNGDMTKMMKDFKFPSMNVEGAMAMQRKNMEALTTANQLAAEGFQTIARRQAEILKESIEDFTGALKDMMSAGSPENNAAKHADIAKHTFERTLANMRELAELAAKSNAEAFEVINKRMVESIDEMKDMAPKK